MAMYAIEFAAQRRQEEPRADLTTLLLETDFNGHYMTDIDFGSFFVQLVTAGNDTTKTMLSSGLLCLLEHPDQLAALRADPSLVPGAVEEILRYANPLHYFRRTATADTDAPRRADQGRRQGRDDLHVGEPRRGRVRRPRSASTSAAARTRTCRSASPSTSASACTSRGSKARCSSRSCSRRSRPSSSPANPVRVRSNLNNALKVLPIRLTR